MASKSENSNGDGPSASDVTNADDKVNDKSSNLQDIELVRRAPGRPKGSRDRHPRRKRCSTESETGRESAIDELDPPSKVCKRMESSQVETGIFLSMTSRSKPTADNFKNPPTNPSSTMIQTQTANQPPHGHQASANNIKNPPTYPSSTVVQTQTAKPPSRPQQGSSSSAKFPSYAVALAEPTKLPPTAQSPPACENHAAAPIASSQSFPAAARSTSGSRQPLLPNMIAHTGNDKPVSIHLPPPPPQQQHQQQQQHPSRCDLFSLPLDPLAYAGCSGPHGGHAFGGAPLPLPPKGCALSAQALPAFLAADLQLRYAGALQELLWSNAWSNALSANPWQVAAASAAGGVPPPLFVRATPFRPEGPQRPW